MSCKKWAWLTLLLRLRGATGLTSLMLPVKSQFLLAVYSEEYNDDTSDVSSSSVLLPSTDGTMIFLRLFGESKLLSRFSLLATDAGEPDSERFVIDFDLWR